MTMALSVSKDVLERIFSFLDRPSLNHFASTSRYSASLVADCSHGADVLGPVLLQLALQHPPNTERSFTALLQLRSAPSVANSPRSSSSCDGSLGSSDTELSEVECGFEMTTEVKARVAQLPDSKPAASLQGLPVELQVEIFGYLDQIDSVCLGLSNAGSYNVYRALHGIKMPLNTRRPVPVHLERVCEAGGKKKPCDHCGNFRCQLYEHIKSWMPKGLEYCQFSQKFGSCAEEGAKDSCYRGKPSKPNRKPLILKLLSSFVFRAQWLTLFLQVAADTPSEPPPSTKMTRWVLA